MQTGFIATTEPDRARARALAQALELLGLEVPCPWWDASVAPEDSAAWERQGILDALGVLAADLVLCFNDDGVLVETPGKGGRHTELGIALTSQKRIVLIGRRTQLSHSLREVACVPDVPALFMWIQDQQYRAWAEAA